MMVIFHIAKIIKNHLTRKNFCIAVLQTIVARMVFYRHESQNLETTTQMGCFGALNVNER